MSRELSRNQENLLKSLSTRHGRKKSGLCLCEGIRCCGEVFTHCPELIEFLVCREELAERYPEAFILPRHKFDKLSATDHPQGVIAVVRRPEAVAEDKPPADPFMLVLDRVGDPGNFGTILRTAKAAGLTEVSYTKGSADPYSDKTIRSAMAAQFMMKLRCFEDLGAIRNFLLKYGYDKFYRTDPHEGNSCFTENGLYERSAVIIGSEAHGVGELEGAEPVTIPMPGNFESLNAAQAATIFIFEYVRRITS